MRPVIFNEYPQTDCRELSSLVCNARKQQPLAKPPAQQRKYLRDQALSQAFVKSLFLLVGFSQPP